MSLEVSIYESAMQQTLRRWGGVRSRDAIHDAVAEAFTRHLGNAREAGIIRAELGTFVARSASEVLFGRRSRGAQEMSTAQQRDAAGEWLDPDAWLAGHLSAGSEDALIELLDAEPPSTPPTTTPAEGAAALADLLAAGWRAVRLAEALNVSESLVCRWRRGHAVNAAAGARLQALVGTPVPRYRPRNVRPRVGSVCWPTDGIDPALIERALRRHDDDDQDLAGGTG